MHVTTYLYHNLCSSVLVKVRMEVLSLIGWDYIAQIPTHQNGFDTKIQVSHNWSLSAEWHTLHPSRCQRCLSRLVPRSAETPLVKGTVTIYVENFRRVTALPKCKSISIKIGLCILGCMNYKTAYSLKQFLPPMPKIATLKTATTRLFTSLCF